MKTGIVKTAILTSILGVQGAFAGDYAPAPAEPEPAPPAAAPWQGIFAGASIGYAVADTEITDPLGGPFSPFPISTDADEPVVTAQLGYNFRRGRMVFGIVGDLTFTKLSDTGFSRPVGPPTSLETEYEWMATLRGRIGMLARENTLIYGHGGLGYTDITNTEVGGVGPFAGVSQSGTEPGYVIGAGIEVKTGAHLSIFAEYAFMDFDTPSSIGTAFGPLPLDHDPVHVVKLGVNYHF